jgi:hypothetical protein
VTPPRWLDEHGKPMATRPYHRCGPSVPVGRTFRLEHMTMIGWQLFAEASWVQWLLLTARQPPRSSSLSRHHAHHHSEQAELDTSTMITKVLMVLVALLALPASGYCQRVVPVPNPGVGPLVHHRYVAVTHLREYLLQGDLLNTWGAWLTRTLLFGVNGTERVANVGVYVLGQGHVLLSLFRSIEPAHESLLLPGHRYFGSEPGSESLLDGVPPRYVGETSTRGVREGRNVLPESRSGRTELRHAALVPIYGEAA